MTEQFPVGTRVKIVRCHSVGGPTHTPHVGEIGTVKAIHPEGFTHAVSLTPRPDGEPLTMCFLPSELESVETAK